MANSKKVKSLAGEKLPDPLKDLGNYDPKKAKDTIKPPKDKDIRTG